jgi:glucokinase
MFSIAANFTDPDAYFVGGGIVEAEPHFRDWCMDIVRASTELRDRLLSQPRGPAARADCR